MDLKSIDIPILSYLSEGLFISGEELSNKLAFSRIDIERQIQQLTQLGYDISVDNQKGYRIISRPDILLPFEIKNKLTTNYIGQTVYYFPELTSTNAFARQKLLEKAEKVPEGTLFIAEKQSDGVGRLGRQWISPSGGIWLSIILYPQLAPSGMPRITLMTAVVIAKTIHQLFSLKVNIKWPNDILFHDKKVCGILTEMSANTGKIRWVIVGIGINTNNDLSEFPEDIQKESISLKGITGEAISRIAFVQHLCVEFEKYYEVFQKNDFSFILDEWRTYSHCIGEKIKMNAGGKVIAGEVIDISEEGALILKKDNGRIVKIISGTLLKQ